jgi:LacI family transcriptional regulator
MDLDSVLVDNVAGARLAVAHLVALGHRRIEYIGGRPRTPEYERLAGYRQGLTAHAIPEDPDLVRRGDSLCGAEIPCSRAAIPTSRIVQLLDGQCAHKMAQSS